MNDSPTVSRSRQKRTQEKTKQARKQTPLISGVMALCYLVTLGGLLLILNMWQQSVFTDFTPGQLAPATVQALVDFETVDLAATELRREQAARSTHAVLEVNTRGLIEARRRLNS